MLEFCVRCICVFIRSQCCDEDVYPNSMLWWNLLAIFWVRTKNSPRNFSSCFFVKSKSLSQSRLVQVSLQCWQSQQICHVQTLSFDICFRILCFQPALVVFYLSVEFVEDLIVVEDHWADSTLALVHFYLFPVTQSSSASRLLCTWSADVPMWSILGHTPTWRVR